MRAPPRFAREWHGHASIMLEESVKGIVNHQPKLTPSQSSESGITLSQCLDRSGKNACEIPSQIFVTHGEHLAPDSSGLFVLFLGTLHSRPSASLQHTHTITSPKPVVSNPFVSALGLRLSSCKQRSGWEFLHYAAVYSCYVFVLMAVAHLSSIDSPLSQCSACVLGSPWPWLRALAVWHKGGKLFKLTNFLIPFLQAALAHWEFPA